MSNLLPSQLNELLTIDDRPTVANPLEDHFASNLRVLCDIALGDYFTWVDIDEEKTRQRMRDEGLSDEEIASHTIAICADGLKPVDEQFTIGNYNLAQKRIGLWPTREIELSRLRVLNALRLIEADDIMTVHFQPGTSLSMSEALWHEIRHAKQGVFDSTTMQDCSNTQHNMKTKAFRRGVWLSCAASLGVALATKDLLPVDAIQATIYGSAAGIASVIGSVPLVNKYVQNAANKAYLNNPNEIDARAAQAEAPSNILVTVAKPSYTTARLTHSTISSRELIETAANLI